jgi:26S proteasome non-ATPase regulatory subunit 10
VKLLIESPNMDEKKGTERPKAKLNVVDNAGHTPLHLAFESGHAETACVLIEAGANRERLDPDGKRPDQLTEVLGDVAQKRILQYVEARCGKLE